MMTNHRNRTLAVLALASLLPLGSLAAAEPTASAATPAKTADAADAAKAEKPRKVEIRCESTSSRIRRVKEEDCAKATQPTTNYYPHDLEKSGPADVGQSLKNLDPRLR